MDTSCATLTSRLYKKPWPTPLHVGTLSMYRNCSPMYQTLNPKPQTSPKTKPKTRKALNPKTLEP